MVILKESGGSEMKKGRVALVISLLITGVFLFGYFSRYHLHYIPADYEILGNTLTLPRFVIEPFVFLVILGIIVNVIDVFALRSSLAMGACVLYGAAIAMKPDAYPYIILECFLCLIAAVRIREKDALPSGSEKVPSGSSSGLRDSHEPRKTPFSSAFYVLNADSELESAGKNTSPVIKTLNGKPVKNSSVSKNSAVLGAIVAIAMVSGVLGVVIPTLLRSHQNRVAQSTSTSQISFGPDLSGYWESSQAGVSTVCAEIEDRSVSVYWINKNGDKNLYWAGSYTPPKNMEEPYSWMSVRDSSKTDGSVFASKDDTMIFTYQNGTILFRAKIAGSIDMMFTLRRAQSTS